MELSDFSYLADENISTQLIDFIRQKNIFILSVREQKLQVASDEALIQIAEKKILLF